MRIRIVLLVLFALPLLWGAVDLLRAAATTGSRCPGLQTGADGESEPGPMRPGHSCALSYDAGTGRSAGTSTYEQVRYAQEVRREDLAVRGTVLTVYGAAGVAVVTVAARRRAATV